MPAHGLDDRGSIPDRGTLRRAVESTRHYPGGQSRQHQDASNSPPDANVTKAYGFTFPLKHGA